jgi:hypothetical protein
MPRALILPSSFSLSCHFCTQKNSLQKQMQPSISFPLESTAFFRRFNIIADNIAGWQHVESRPQQVQVVICPLTACAFPRALDPVILFVKLRKQQKNFLCTVLQYE